jgi:hypothetical protein
LLIGWVVTAQPLAASTMALRLNSFRPFNTIPLLVIVIITNFVFVMVLAVIAIALHIADCCTVVQGYPCC